MSHRYVTSILIAIIRVEVSWHEIHDFIQLRSWTEPCRLVMVPSIRPEIIKKEMVYFLYKFRDEYFHAWMGKHKSRVSAMEALCSLCPQGQTTELFPHCLL